MKIRTCIMLAAIGVAAMVFAAGTDERVSLDFRLAPIVSGIDFVCRLQNISDQNIKVDDILYGGNGFEGFHLNSSIRNRVLFSLPTSEDDPYKMVLLGERHEWRLTMEDMKNVFLPNEVKGRYLFFNWYPLQVHSSGIYLGYLAATGNIAPPVVDPRDPTAKPILAFVFNENQTNELGFVFLNGSNETVTVEKPLTQASRIVAISPAIEYTKELFIAGQPSENIAIEAGQVGEWRIPWPTIRDLIPAADLAAIKAGGGDLDLVWKVGEFESDPLPISLAEPEPN
jgi:hypothetical protein